MERRSNPSLMLFRAALIGWVIGQFISICIIVNFNDIQRVYTKLTSSKIEKISSSWNGYTPVKLY